MILDSIIKITSTIVLSTVFVGLGGPILGEVISTTAPFFGRQADQAAETIGIDYEAVAFQTDDGILLRGWYFPASEPGRPAVLYAPSTGNDQRSGLSLVKPLHDAGYGVLLFSYRGSGKSQGNPFGFTYGANESHDVDAAVAFLHRDKGITRIAAIGHSAGAVAIILSASRNPNLNALVAASPFTSVEEIWLTNRPSWMPLPLFNLMMRVSEWRKGFTRNQVRPIDVIGRIAPRPILLMQGMSDQRITLPQARALFSKAGNPKTVWYLGGLTHAEVRTIGIDDHMDEIIQFLNSALSAR